MALLTVLQLLDCILAYHINHRPRLEIRDATVPLPCAELLWEAKTAMQWQQALPYSAPSPSLASALESIYIEKKLQPTMGEFSRIIMIHGLYQRLYEVRKHLTQPLTYWTPTAARAKPEEVIPKDLWLPGIPMYCNWRNSTCDSLDILHWSASSVIGAASGMEHPTVAHLHLSRVILLIPIEDIQRFACGISGVRVAPREQISALRKVVRRWALEDYHKARLAIVHAGCIFWHIRRYSASAFYEPHAVLLAGLSLWAYGMFTDREHSEPEATEPSFAEDETSLPASINLDRPCDDELIQTFIRRGGKMLAMMSGVGDVCSLEGPKRILEEAIKLLRTLTNWGCSGNAIRILKSLSQVSRQTVLAE
ncbi:putative C2H2 transcription factor [Rhizodiscina lignyota]|uniref:C2H2 transcription factor n=1 Tax=Rhizodiscina lignyota TaxID=1504668 RepID=A0A9P4IB05_9PEZI|nr:putative C2H2 transcription factor [Rhizodiscina lignyota]